MKLKEALKGKLTKGEISLVPSAYDLVGDLAIFSEFPESLNKKQERLVGDTLLGLHKQVKVVLKKVGKYSGRFRTHRLKIIAGERRKETVLWENGCRFIVHPEKSYWSSRLGSERKRVYGLVKAKESVLVMFSGVGPYVVEIAKHAQPRKIVSVEANPDAVSYQEKNLIMNKISGVVLKKGGVEKIVPRLKGTFDRIFMPLPMGGEAFFDLALSKAKKDTVIHFYMFHNEEKVKEIKDFIYSSCKHRKLYCKILGVVKCGQFGPGLFRFCFDIKIV